jgi:hypothetical protein
MKTTNEKQDEEEISILKYFSKKYSDFPKGKLVKTESPDFILKINPRKSIGIELTKLAQSKFLNQEFTPHQIESLEKDIVKKAKMIYESKHNLKFYLNVFFPGNLKISKNNSSKLANDIAQLIHNKTFEKDSGSYYSINIEKSELPEYIDSILIIYHPEVKGSIWNNAGGYSVPELSKELLEHRINKKEEKLNLYQKRKINKFWLVITADTFERSTSFNIHNKIDNWTFDSKFDKIFLFELFGRKIYELK